MRRTLASSVFLLQKEMLHSLCRRGEGKVFSVWLSQSESGQNGTKQLKKVLKNKNRDLTQSTNLQLGTARNCQGRQWQSCISMRGPFRPSLSANIKYVIIVTAMNVEDKQIKRGVHFDLMETSDISETLMFLSLPRVAHRSPPIHFASSGVRLHSRLRKLTEWVISDEGLSWRHINCLKEDSAVNEILRPPSLPH